MNVKLKWEVSVTVRVCSYRGVFSEKYSLLAICHFLRLFLCLTPLIKFQCPFTDTVPQSQVYIYFPNTINTNMAIVRKSEMSSSLTTFNMSRNLCGKRFLDIMQPFPDFVLCRMQNNTYSLCEMCNFCETDLPTVSDRNCEILNLPVDPG